MNTLGGPDMMLGITQDALNTSIAGLFRTPSDRKDPGSDTIISHKLEAGGHRIEDVINGTDERTSYLTNYLHADIDQPFVDLNDVTDAPAARGSPSLAVRVFIPIKSGFCSYNHLETGQRREVQIGGLRISYIVKFSQNDVATAQRDSMVLQSAGPIGRAAVDKSSKAQPGSSAVAALFGPFESAESICKSFRLESWNEQRRAYAPVKTCGDNLFPLILGCLVDAAPARSASTYAANR